MKASLKTGVLLPRGSMAHERSKILSRVQDDLNVLRVASEQQQAKNRRQAGMRFKTCEHCLCRGLKMTMREFMLKGHLVNHRILQALGQEDEWIQELIEGRQARIRRLKAVGVREQAAAIRMKRATMRREWLWQHTVLKMRDRQRRRLAWITLAMASPIWLVPVSLWPKSHKAILPNELAVALEVLQSMATRLMDEVVSVVCSGWLSPADRAAIQQSGKIRFVAHKVIDYALDTPLTFVAWSMK